MNIAAEVVAPEFSDFIVYVDESGDHGMLNVDPNYPIFCSGILHLPQAALLRQGRSGIGEAEVQVLWA